jgi:HD-GYP domain-containing protein (c-di-GMP phosphodiesterase class II)
LSDGLFCYELSTNREVYGIALDLQQAHQTIGQLVAAWQSFRIYPVKHPIRAQRTKQCCEQLSLLLMHHSPLRIGLTEETLFFGDHLLTDPYIAETEVTDLLNGLKINGIEIVQGLTLDELDLFFALSVYCIQSNKKIENATDLKKLHHLRILTLLEEDEKPRVVYNAAMQAVDQVFNDIQGGRVPSTEGLRNISKSMVQSILRDEHGMFALAQIKDYDNYTFNHSVNVGIIALSVGHACMIDPQQLHLLAFGGMVHDIGKLKIPVEIINKPGRLTEAELNLIRRHPVSGMELLSQVSGIQQEIIDMVHYHHLHYNGAGGYPKRPGRNLSPLIDMVTIADLYDAMTTHRTYQRSMPPREVIRYMKTVRGTVLHPEFLSYFMHYLGDYPVGSLIRLKNAEILLVIGLGELGNQHLKLRRLFTANGKPDPEKTLTELLPNELDRIVSDVDPLTRGIDTSAYFD